MRLVIIFISLIASMVTFADEFNLPGVSDIETFQVDVKITSSAGSRLEYSRDGTNWIVAGDYTGRGPFNQGPPEILHKLNLSLIKGDYTFRMTPYQFGCEKTPEARQCESYPRSLMGAGVATTKKITITATPKATTNIYLVPAALSCNSDFSISWAPVLIQDTTTLYRVEERTRAIGSNWSEWREVVNNINTPRVTLPTGKPSGFEYQFRVSTKYQQGSFESAYSEAKESYNFVKPNCQSNLTQFDTRSLESGIAFNFTPPNSSFISYNRLVSFDYTNKNIKIMNLNKWVHNGIESATKLFIIEADSVQLTGVKLEIVGATADVLLIDTKAGSQVGCASCQLTNIGRMTFAAANASAGLSQNTSKVGELVPYPSADGQVRLSDIEAAGVTSLDIIGHSVSLEGRINTNTKGAMVEGKPAHNPLGQLTFGSGGVNVFAGGIATDYDSQQITRIWPPNPKAVVKQTNGIYSAAVKIAAYDTLNITGELNTHSDALVATEYQGRQVTPTELINLQVFSNTGFVTVGGSLVSDNQILLQSAGWAEVNNLMQASRIVAIAGKQLTNFSNAVYNAANSMQLEALAIDNRGSLLGKAITASAENYLINQFGGEIKADTISLTSQKSFVRNGSLKPYDAESNLYATTNSNQTTYNHGLYYTLDNNVTSFKPVKSLSAKIIGSNVGIYGQEVHNVNPYYRVRPSEEDWSKAVVFQPVLMNQVEILGGKRLEVNASTLLKNSSATMGTLSPSSDFIIKAPRIINERYRMNYALDVNRSSSDTTLRSVVYIASPPGQIFAQGAFELSASESFLNKSSYIEVEGKAILSSPRLMVLGQTFDSQTRSKVSKTCIAPVSGPTQWVDCSYMKTDPSVTIGNQDALFAMHGVVEGNKATLITETGPNLIDSVRNDAMGDGTVINYADGRKVTTKKLEHYDYKTTVSIETCDVYGVCKTTTKEAQLMDWLAEYSTMLKESVLSAWDLMINWFAS